MNLRTERFAIVLWKRVKYLGIHICWNNSEQWQVNFSPKLEIQRLYMLQRDISIWGRTLLTKMEGVNLPCSLDSDDSICKAINNWIIDFVWRNRHHFKSLYYKSSYPQERGWPGTSGLHCVRLHQTFKIKEIKKCICNPKLLIFLKKLGGFNFG